MFKRFLACIMLFGYTILFIGGCCSPALIGSLPVTLHPQETQNWCWAASGQMVMDYLGHNVSQCVQANNRFGRNDCCEIDLCPTPTEPPTYDASGNCVGCPCGGWPESSSSLKATQPKKSPKCSNSVSRPSIHTENISWTSSASTTLPD